MPRNLVFFWLVLLTLFISLFIDSDYIKNTGFWKICGKNIGKISNVIGHKKLMIKEKFIIKEEIEMRGKKGYE